MKFVIVGGDAAGMSAASRAKRNRPDTEVVVFEMTQDVSYSACGMPYNIADPAREIDDLVVRQARVFREKQGIDLRTGSLAESVDPSNKKLVVRTPGGREEVLYDKLLLATGANPVIPDIPGVDHAGVLALKSLEDGRKIKQFIRERGVEKAVIIGMGYIALEMCEALRANGIGVEMVKPRPALLPWMNESLSQMVRAELDAHQVGIYAGHEILRIEETGEGLRAVCRDLELDGHMVLAAIGVAPNSRIAEDAGLDLGPKGSIAVDRTLRTSRDDIFAAGDCADAFHVISGERTWIPLALRANRAGWAVADNVTGRPVELQGIVGTAVFKVFDLEVARTGFSMAEAERAGFDPVEVMITGRSRAHAHPGNCKIGIQMMGDRSSGRLLGVQMVGREGVAHRINAPAVALQTGMSVEAFSQCDLAYAPPFSPVWDPMLTAANQLLKKL